MFAVTGRSALDLRLYGEMQGGAAWAALAPSPRNRQVA